MSLTLKLTVAVTVVAAIGAVYLLACCGQAVERG